MNSDYERSVQQLHMTFQTSLKVHTCRTRRTHRVRPWLPLILQSIAIGIVGQQYELLGISALSMEGRPQHLLTMSQNTLKRIALFDRQRCAGYLSAGSSTLHSVNLYIGVHLSFFCHKALPADLPALTSIIYDTSNNTCYMVGTLERSDTASDRHMRCGMLSDTYPNEEFSEHVEQLFNSFQCSDDLR